MFVLWFVSILLDRFWLVTDNSIPAWDQAEYLNNALNHGRNIGLLPGGDGWQGFDSFLDLSPKIPPLSSVISSLFITFVGDDVDNASWVLSFWNGLMLVVIASWARQLGGNIMGLLSAAFVLSSPFLSFLRVNFTLDMPLTAITIMTLWILGIWLRPSEKGGGTWLLSLLLGLMISASLLIKQSAILILFLPVIWASIKSVRHSKRRLQIITSLAIIIMFVLPWFHHNWISIIGGTHRAVFVSGMEEGDPGIFDIANWYWYPRLWLNQIGKYVLIIGSSGLLLERYLAFFKEYKSRFLLFKSDWSWLCLCIFNGLLLLTLTPNKDTRYIAPIIPLLIIVLSRGWVILYDLFSVDLKIKSKNIILSLIYVLVASPGVFDFLEKRKTINHSPASEIISELQGIVGKESTTLLISASSPDINDQTLSYFGRRSGGQIDVRRVGINPEDSEEAINHGGWWLLANGDQGTWRQSARELSRKVRSDGRFQLVRNWEWSEGRQLELWRRRLDAPNSKTIDTEFIGLARQMENGPRAVSRIFSKVSIWHLLDPRFSYQNRVYEWANKTLEIDSMNKDALWSLSLLSILKNRPIEAEQFLTRLEKIEGKGLWATSYKSIVLLADWDCKPVSKMEINNNEIQQSPVQLATLHALRDVGRTMCFDSRGFINLSRTLRNASKLINQEIEDI